MMRAPNPTRPAATGACSASLPGLPRRTVLQAALAGACLPRWAHAADPGATRVALVIGNAAYAGAPLLNPLKDARAMSALLRDTGFQVVEARDAGKAQMEAAIAEMRARLQGRQGVGLLYYAGHGLQLDWRNYLLPVDAQPTRAADVPAQAVDVQSVLQAFKEAGNRMNILVLDACRDNPFPASASAKGLAPLDAPPGTFFAYATAPGHVAEDGSAQDGNGLYTRFLLQELQRKDARIEDVFKRVRLQVRQASQGRQIPWESTSLEDDFVFATGQKAEAASAGRRDAEFEVEKAEWDRIKESTRPEDIYAFLQRHPSGPLSEQAQFRLDQLSRPAVQAQQQVTSLPPGVDRYRVGDAWEMERTDFLAGGEKMILRFRVTGIDGGRVLINNGGMIVDQMGGVLLNRSGAKDPAVVVAPSDLQVGKRWRSAFYNARGDGPRSRNFYEYRVVALEDLVVPAGRIKAYKIEGLGEAVLPTQTTTLQNTLWINPATMMVARQVVRQGPARGGALTEHSEFALRWHTPAPRT